MTAAARALPRGRLARALLARGALLGAIWWAFAEGDPYAPLVALAVVALAVATSLLVAPPGAWRLRPLGLLRFGVFFVHQSVRGGVDVARRAIDPRLPIAPGFLSYRLALPVGTPRLLMTSVVSLLPGTLSVALRDDELLVHVLDLDADVAAELRRLEARVGAVFEAR